MDKTYLDKYDNPKDKSKAVIENIICLARFKDIDTRKLSTDTGHADNYFYLLRKSGEIKFSELLKVCEYLGVSVNKIMSFNYTNIVKNKQLEENEAKLKAMESEIAKLRILVKEQKKDLIESQIQERRERE